MILIRSPISSSSGRGTSSPKKRQQEQENRYVFLRIKKIIVDNYDICVVQDTSGVMSTTDEFSWGSSGGYSHSDNIYQRSSSSSFYSSTFLSSSSYLRPLAVCDRESKEEATEETEEARKRSSTLYLTKEVVQFFDRRLALFSRDPEHVTNHHFITTDFAYYKFAFDTYWHKLDINDPNMMSKYDPNFFEEAKKFLLEQTLISSYPLSEGEE